jgi:hypothetical protein
MLGFAQTRRFVQELDDAAACAAALRVVPFKCLWKEVQACAGAESEKIIFALSLDRDHVTFCDILRAADSRRASVIVRPSTLVRSMWADDGRSVARTLLDISHQPAFRFEVHYHAPVQRRRHDDSRCQG